MLVLNRSDFVLVAQRSDIGGEAWQMPQGGIDPGEPPRAAALRELKEEIGTGKVDLIGESKRWLSYDLPPDLQGMAWKGRYRGQTQKWFAFRFLGGERDIDLGGGDAEFVAWRWIPFEDASRHHRRLQAQALSRGGGRVPPSRAWAGAPAHSIGWRRIALGCFQFIWNRSRPQGGPPVSRRAAELTARLGAHRDCRAHAARWRSW